MKRISLGLAAILAGATPAFAHVGHGVASSFAAGIAHPLGGLDHIAVMVAVGLWAALKGGRALWLWPATFVGVMLVGGALGMSGSLAHVALPFVEPAILASVVALGLLVALAVDLPVAVGAAVIGAFALFHGHAHGTEAAGLTGFEYMAGFALATATLHALGIGFALMMQRASLRPVIRAAGVVCVVVGAVLITGVV